MMCRRHGCERPITRTGTCCSSACKAALLELEAARNLVDHLGTSGPVDAFIAAAESLNAALTETHTRRAELQALAVEAGWSAENFKQLCRGELSAQSQESGTGPPPASGNPHPGLETESVQGFQK